MGVDQNAFQAEGLGQADRLAEQGGAVSPQRFIAKARKSAI